MARGATPLIRYRTLAPVPRSPRLLAVLASIAVAGASAGRIRALEDPPACGERSSHWAFRPVERAELPHVADPSWPCTPVDFFVLARLEAAGLTPSPKADSRALVRRLWFDMLGLPPELEVVERFARDPRPDAWEMLVDRVLADPAYGERWGRHWLDVARYADTKGYVDAGERRYPFAWTYRDWVIDAFAEGLPFDRFVTEQIAADRLYEAKPDGPGDPSAFAALGFLTVGQRFNFFPEEVLDDRIDVVTRGFLGLTVACARCHDHKYDPIPTTDYYALRGVFASSREPAPDEEPLIRSLASRAEAGEAADAKLAADLGEAAEKLHRRRRELHATIASELRSRAGDYLRYIVELLPEHRTMAQPPLRTPRGLLREVTAYGRGAVARWRRCIEERGDDDPVFGFWNRVVRLEEGEIAVRAPEILAALGESSCRAINSLVRERFEREPPKRMVDIATGYGELLEETERLSKAAREKESEATVFEDPEREELRLVLYGEDSPAVFSLDESEDLYHLDEHTQVRSLHAEVERIFLRHADASPRAMALIDREHPIDPVVFLRGDPDRTGKSVPRRFLSVLSRGDPQPFPEGVSGRLALARAIVDPRNPLTARVIVNRVWEWHFGRGLVDAASDFGVRTAPPSHPKLLDWLAAGLVENGWSLRWLHREILLSATWCQASRDRPEARRVDPEDRLLARAHRRRLDFEAMRDSMLAVARRLDRRSGGPPVEAAPDDPNGTRRTVYLLLDREYLPGVLRVFDFPSPDFSSPGRSHTTVPQQALFLLNAPFVIARAEDIALHLDRSFAPEDVGGRIRALWRRVLLREPRDDELALAGRHVEARLRDLAAEREAPPPRAASWSYGYGAIDPSGARLQVFRELPHFAGDAWQGSASYPDSDLHWLRLTATGGHAGIDSEHLPVRRWTAPRAGIVSIEGRLIHGIGNDRCGDGIEAWILGSGAGEIAHFTARTSEIETNAGDVTVAPGDTIDFVVGPRSEHSCDAFAWAPIIRLRASVDAGDQEDGGSAPAKSRRVVALELKPGTTSELVFDAQADFAGPGGGEKAPLSAWAELAQILLESNEFQFVD